MKKLLTLEQLSDFCKSNNYMGFSSEDSGYTLSVQVPGKLVFAEKESNTLLYTTVKVCHTLLNRNGSYISEENMKKAMPTLKNQPLLASIIETENGELDFNGHDMEIIENEDGSSNIKYIEQQIGCFDSTEDPYLYYDEDQDKTYVMATAAIPREYTKAAEIIERKKGTKVSCELMINKMSYNAKEQYLELEDFEFSGVCCLGEHVGEGMLGSRLDIKDFSTENHNENIGELSKNTRKEEEELENEEIQVEEVVEIQEEEVIEVQEEETTVEENPITDEEVSYSVEHTISCGDIQKSFSISLNEKIHSIQKLVNHTYYDDDDWYSVEVFEDSKIVNMYGWSKSYRQTYEENEDSFTLVGDREEIHSVWMTKEEEESFNEMKANYSSTIEELKAYEEKLEKYESESDKMNILNSNDYSQVSNSEEFKELLKIESHFDLSVEEVEKKANEILLNYAKNNTLTFSNEKVEKKDKVMFGSSFETKTDAPYGGIFNGFNK